MNGEDGVIENRRSNFRVDRFFEGFMVRRQVKKSPLWKFWLKVNWPVIKLRYDNSSLTEEKSWFIPRKIVPFIGDIFQWTNWFRSFEADRSTANITTIIISKILVKRSIKCLCDGDVALFVLRKKFRVGEIIRCRQFEEFNCNLFRES